MRGRPYRIVKTLGGLYALQVKRRIFPGWHTEYTRAWLSEARECLQRIRLRGSVVEEGTV